MNFDEQLLQEAIDQSRASVEKGGFPVGALLAKDGEIVVTGLSNGKQLADPTSHAEVVAIRSLCAQLGRRNLKEYTLYTSMVPCLMCYGAAFWASIPRIVYACPKEILSWQHSEGAYDLGAINTQTRRPIELVHFKNLQQSALDVIQKWERA